MKNILIFGANSYIGEAVERWLLKEPQKYTVTTIDSKTYKEDEVDFSSYQVIFYVAGIAHIKETDENKHLYYQVNRDLTCNVAKKAKKEGVSHFVLMSSLSVYGLDSGVIDENTEENPITHYGKSKLEADNIIIDLMDDDFKVTLLRPPMVYGRDCKGNYQFLRKLAIKLPFFPKINNKRSMIFIDNLCDYIEWIIDSGSTGIYIPQNDEYVCTSDMVNLVSQANGKKIYLSSIMGCMVKLLPAKIKNKAFGSLICSGKNLRKNYIPDFKKTIYLSEESETE